MTLNVLGRSTIDVDSAVRVALWRLLTFEGRVLALGTLLICEIPARSTSAADAVTNLFTMLLRGLGEDLDD